jgi:hypothetical protein
MKARLKKTSMNTPIAKEADQDIETASLVSRRVLVSGSGREACMTSLLFASLCELDSRTNKANQVPPFFDNPGGGSVAPIPMNRWTRKARRSIVMVARAKS